MIYTLLAFDLARERAREADHLRRVHEARTARASGRPAAPSLRHEFRHAA